MAIIENDEFNLLVLICIIDCWSTSIIDVIKLRKHQVLEIVVMPIMRIVYKQVVVKRWSGTNHFHFSGDKFSDYLDFNLTAFEAKRITLTTFHFVR